MFKTYKYRIYPDQAQISQIEKTFGVCRLVYNIALQTKSEAYKANGTKLSAFDLGYQMVEMKQDYDWMQEVSSQSLYAAIKNMDSAFKNFFRGAAYPKFKSKRSKQSFQCQGGIRRVNFEKGLLTIPKIHDIPAKISRAFCGTIKTVTISRVPSGKYFASILVDDGRELPVKIPVSENSIIGIDLGLKDFAIISDGTTIGNPKHYKKNLKRLKCLQRRMSRKKKGGKNRKKAIKRLAIQHEKIANMRQDFLHKISSAITKQYDTIVCENLSIANMVRNHSLAQAIYYAGWGEFLRQTKYKCEWGGKNYLEVPKFYPSSKTCNVCQNINETLALVDREWTCTNCNTLHDRDENAATNIKQYFLKHSPEGIRGEPVELSTIVETKKQEISNNIPK